MRKKIGYKIREIRKSLGSDMSMKKFGLLFDPPASKGVVSNWENDYNYPNEKRLKQIADLGNITVEQLLYDFDPNKLIKDFTKKDYEAFVSVLEDREPEMAKLLKDIKDSDLIGQVSSDLKEKNISMGEVITSGIVSNEKKKIKNVMDEIQILIDNNKKAKDGFQKTNDTIVKILEVALRELEVQYDSLDSL